MFEGLFQPMHLIFVLAIVLIVFGPGKLPEVGKALGESIRNLKKALNDVPPSEAKALPKPDEVERQDQHGPE